MQAHVAQCQHLNQAGRLQAEEARTNEIGKLGILGIRGDAVQLAQLGEVELLQGERQLHGVQRVAFVLVIEFGLRQQDAVQLHAAAAPVLLHHQLLRVLPLLLAALPVRTQRRRRPTCQHLDAGELCMHALGVMGPAYPV